MNVLHSLAAAAMLACAAPVDATQQLTTQEAPARLVVHGDAESGATPDRAVVALGATVQAPKASDAQGQVNQVMQAAIAAIRELGVPEERIQTTGLSLQPVHSQPRPDVEYVPRVVAYAASNVVRVELADLAQIGRVIDAGIASGANELQGISFQLADDTHQRADALRRAARNARLKAEALAEAAGVVLGELHAIEEGGVQSFEPMYGAGRMAMEAKATPIQPGEVRVHASVTLTYRIRPASAGQGR